MRLIDADALKLDMGCTDAVKYSNKTAEQQHNSYSTLMLYEIADCIDDAPTIDAVSPKVLEQYKWERDVAIKQLEELGIGFGEKKPDMQVVKHGRYDAGGDCTVCGYPMPTDDRCDAIFPDEIKYCYNCGAKMDAEEEN